MFFGSVVFLADPFCFFKGFLASVGLLTGFFVIGGCCFYCFLWFWMFRPFLLLVSVVAVVVVAAGGVAAGVVVVAVFVVVVGRAVVVGMLGCWVVGLLGCWFVGL